MRLPIKHSTRVALAISTVALGLALSACGDEEGDETADSGAAASDAAGGLVSVQSVDGMDVLVDAEGRTLYTAMVERDGGILCVDACTSFWDPVLASDSEASSAASDLGLDLGLVDRPGGERQLTLDRVPLYSFTDEGPGQLEGDGFVDDFQGTRFEWEAASAGDAEGSTDPDPAGESSGDDPGGIY
jgi:predicted lipoprotein with Yx(FWY)xxD motif